MGDIRVTPEPKLEGRYKVVIDGVVVLEGATLKEVEKYFEDRGKGGKRGKGK